MPCATYHKQAVSDNDAKGWQAADTPVKNSKTHPLHVFGFMIHYFGI